MTYLLVIAAMTLGSAVSGSPAVHAAPGAIQDLQHVIDVSYSTARPDAPSLRDSIGADVAGAGDSLECRIEPFCPHVWVNGRPRFRVRITNRSHRAVLLVRPVVACFGREFPRYTLDFVGPPGGRRSSDHISIHTDSLRVADFVRLEPGKRVDLFGPPGVVQDQVSLVRPGRYVAQFAYRTGENDLRHWLGAFQPDSLDAAWHDRFRHTARVDLHAECAFEVQQR